MKKEYFFLFGYVARVYENDSFKEALKSAKEGNDFSLSSYIPSEDGSPLQLLNEASGWENHVEIKKSEYLKLLAVQTAQVEEA